MAGCAVPGTTSYYAIATGGLILRRSGSSWGQDAAGLTNLELTAIAASSPSDVYIVGTGGIVLHRY